MRNLSICERLHIVSCLHALCTMLHEPHTHLWTHMAQDRVVFAKRWFHLHVSPMMSHAHSSSSSCWHMSSPPSSLSLSSSSSTTSTSQVTLPINKHWTNHSMRSMALWPKQPLLQVLSPTWSTTPTTQRHFLVRCGTRRWAYQKSAIFTTVHSGARRSSEPETNLSFSSRKFVTSSVLFHTNKNGETRVRTRFKFVSKTEIKSRPGNKQIRILLERQKEQILAEVRSEIQKHEMQADSDRRSIQELTEIIHSQRMEIDHTMTRDEPSRRDQLLLQEEISEQNRALRETCIRNVRDMEKLQKSNERKVEEISRSKLTEDFEAVTSFFQGSNVKTIYNFGDNDAKYPDAEIDDVHTGNSLASALFLQEREPSASLFQAFTHKEKACFNVHSQFLASKEKPVTGCHKKRKSNQELENCQIRIILERQGNNCSQKQNPRSWNMKTERILPKIWFCELKRQTDSQAVEIGHTRTRYEQSRREQALLHKEVADRERALRDTRIWSIQKLEDLKRDQDFRLEEFSVRKLVENHFKDVESVRSGQLFHVPNEQTLFPPPREPRGLLSRD